MPLPTLDKTWQFQINQTVTAQGSALATSRRLARILKVILVGFSTNPWTVQGSSDAVAAGMDAVDRWDSDSDLTWAASGVAHSWIVLRQTGIATNFELCIDLNSASTAQGSIVVSPSAGFTGGSTTNRPTATDEISIITTTTIWDGLDSQHQIHAMQSSDGQCTRFSIWRSGTNNCVFALFDKPKNPVSGWTNPSVSFWVADTSSIAATYSNLGNLGASAKGRGRGTGTFNIAMTGEGDSNASGFLASDATLGSVANSFSAEWPMFPVGVASTTASHIGRHGSLFDLWWRPLSVSDADTFPNNASARQFVALGNVVLPWTGGSDVPALT